MNPVSVLWEYRDALLSGARVTFWLVFTAAAAGTVAGAAIAVGIRRLGKLPVLAADTIAFCLSAIPPLVVLFWLYYPAQEISGVSLTPFATALSALVLINTFAVYRIVVDAENEFPQQYISTALVCGLTPLQTTLRITAPLVVRSALPRWIDQQVGILQLSVFASIISVEEIFRTAQRINSHVYEPVTIYTAMALVFLATAGSALYLAKRLRRRFRNLSER